MLVVWRGRGWLIAVIVVASLVATELAVEATFEDPSYYQTHGWPKLAGFLLAAAVLQIIASSRLGKSTIRDEAGRETMVDRGDSLFYVPLRHWPKVCIALGLVFLFVTSAGS